MLRRDLLVSLAVLAGLVFLAEVGLALDENWRKMARVFLAFITYAALLVAWFGLWQHAPRLVLWPFILAAGAAEAASGWLRPDQAVSIDLRVVALAGLLLGGFHWFALRTWRPLRERFRP